MQCGVAVIDEAALMMSQTQQSGMVSQQYYQPVQNAVAVQQYQQPYQQFVQPVYTSPSQGAPSSPALSCKRCGSQNVSIQMMQVAGKTKRK